MTIKNLSKFTKMHVQTERQELKSIIYFMSRLQGSNQLRYDQTTCTQCTPVIFVGVLISSSIELPFDFLKSPNLEELFAESGNFQLPAPQKFADLGIKCN